ncbi:Chondroadherin-like protein [Holothuria leucospilota]|uniref:Chondroadherin-like protein n=1 Tax=Holothuria leucospilota TaxID=206669 RepID=A0A9Q0YCR7_HOLLE|nr:Chondroadherin-like protein [Holothuria leucospilota]
MYPYVLFFIRLLGSIKTVGLQPFDDPPSCRQVCYFDENYNNADCSGVDLREVPTSDGCRQARMLDLSYNRITSLHTNGLLGYDHVKHLDLSSNVVSALEPRSFAGCFSVVYIYLSSNRIEILPNEEFAECNDTLQQLHLERNELVIIESGALKHLTKLTHLFLSHNRLQRLNVTIFEDLRSLESLYLNSNGLTSLDGSLFENLSRLQNLDLSNNGLVVIGDELFSPRCQLVTFILANNLLRNIPNPSCNHCLNRLQTLDIRNNNISDATNITRYIHTTEKLFIDGNPFHCDCSLEDVRVWIQAEVTSRTSSELSCIVPSSGETRLIRSLSDLCPTTTAPLATSSPSSKSSQRQVDKQRTNLPTSGGIFSTKDVKSNKFVEEEDAKDAKLPTVAAEALVIEDGPLSYKGLVVMIMVVAILVFILLLSMIILLAICLCQTNKNVKKMTKAILESRVTPRPLKKVVSRAKEFTSSKLSTDNRERIKFSNEKTNETPLKRPRSPRESTPKELKIDISGTNVRRRTPQSTDKMISNNSPNKITKTKNNQTTSKIDNDFLGSANKNDEERRPFIRKLKYDEITEGSQETDHVNELTSGPEGKDIESKNISENHDYVKEDSLKQSFQEKNSENGSQEQGKNLKLPKIQRKSGGKNDGALKGSDRDKERLNNHNYDRENFNQTKDSESGCQNQGKDVKIRLEESPQKGRERKLGVLKESDCDNINLTSSNC